jgi:hypothetical protein
LIVISDRDLVESIDVEFDDAVPEFARGIMGQYMSAMKASVVALPEEAVGPGARWRQQIKMRSNNVRVVDDAIYELLEVNDDVVVIARKDTQRAPRQAMPLPGGGSAELLSLAGVAHSSLTVDLRAYLPTRDEASLDVTLRMGGKGKRPLTMRMSTKISGTSTTAPAR